MDLKLKNFNNYNKLTSYQKHRLVEKYEAIVREAVQHAINEMIKERKFRREELDAHMNPDDPFHLDLGGEG